MGRTQLAKAAVCVVVAGFSAACSGSKAPEHRIVLQARAGTYNDGSGRLGLALLTTVRDVGGRGPGAGASVSVRDPVGELVAAFDYVPGGAGSFQVSWWNEVAPSAGTYEVDADAQGESLSTRPLLPSGDSLPAPAVDVAADGGSLTWPAVPGAAGYACRVSTAAGVLVLDRPEVDPTCDVSALPAGSYFASVIAVSADLDAISSDASSTPPLPARFDVSEARIAFARGDVATPSAVVHAAGGAYDDGAGPRALAIWLSLANLDATPVAEPWDVQVVGPGLPADAPLVFTYPARFPRLLVWAPGVASAAGTYTLTAAAAGASVVTRFTVGDPAWLDLPAGVVARDGAQGSATATWDAVPGARSYLATAYDSLTGAVAASAWVPGASAGFPQGTFTPGRSYDVYVAASDADMVGGAVPTQVSVAENVFEPSSFVAR